MEKTRKFQIVYADPTNLCQHSTTDLVRGIMTNERKQSALSKVGSFKHSKTTSSFLYVMYYQRAGKTSHFHMRGVGKQPHGKLSRGKAKYNRFLFIRLLHRPIREHPNNALRMPH